MSEAARIEEIAARWVMRRDEPDWSPDEAVELEAWLEASPHHRVAFWRLNDGWRAADRLAALQEPRPAPRRSSRPLRSLPMRRPRLIGSAVAACLGLVVISIMFGDVFSVRRFETEVGGRQIVPLADGSRVELNTDTRLRAEVTGGGRAVWLDRGEAYFEIAHDPEHPFVVHAGSRTVTVLGTKFSVRRDGDRVEVAVIEGRVRVAADGDENAPHILRRGDVALAQGDALLVAPPSVEKVEDQLSWRRGLLTFDQTRLADAVAEINRYNRRQIVIADPAIADMRINGAFPATEVDVFARLLQRGFGFRVEQGDDELRIFG